MSIANMLYQLIIYPLELLYEYLYSIELRFIPSQGICIILLSFMINLLLLPVYELLDEMGRRQSVKDRELSHWISHIKSTFEGDERFFMLRTYYRQNHYRPFDAMKGVMPLLLEIPFFIAAYHFLSNLQRLDGEAFWKIRDLGAQDRLLFIAGTGINLLPIVMTLINLISASIFTEGMSGRERVRLYGVSLLFAVLLYRSPSGLVLYWTCNNLFAMLKNLAFSKRAKSHIQQDTMLENQNRDVLTGFILCELILILLLGVVIPSAVIRSSPMEFVDITDPHNPLCFLKGSIAIAVGYFGLWIPLFYVIAKKARRMIGMMMSVFSGIALVDYFFFATDKGYISVLLRYVDKWDFTISELNKNLAAVCIVLLVGIILHKYRTGFLKIVKTAELTALIVFAIMNVHAVTRSYGTENRKIEDRSKISIPLSKTGKNVVVIMLDRAIGGYIPYIMNEKPELKEQFSGFTYYPNTVSFGPSTLWGSPPIFGGYEYTAMGIATDNQEKRIEALKMMPKLFSDHGYLTTVFDPPVYLFDLSIYDDMPVRAFQANKQFPFPYGKGYGHERRYRNFFCYSLCKAVPLWLHESFYDDGYYNDMAENAERVYYYKNRENKMSQGTSFNLTFEQQYEELRNFPLITELLDEDQGTFIMCCNDATHEPTILREPDYTPVYYVDNTLYDEQHWDRFELNGKKLRMDNYDQMYHYQVNMAALLQLGRWFDYLKENGVYDNTRIILVGDHGQALGQIEELLEGDWLDAMALNPLLMVKDFNAQGFSEDRTFMTNADVPTIATKDLIENPVNPYTGKELSEDPKKKGPVTIRYKYQVEKDIFNSENWKKLVSE